MYMTGTCICVCSDCLRKYILVILLFPQESVMIYKKTTSLHHDIQRRVLPIALLAALTVSIGATAPAFATDTSGTSPYTGFARGTETIPLEKRPGYVPTPLGEQSEAYGFTKTGPNHLRRMSRTEPLAAEPQIIRVLPAEPQTGTPR